MPNSLNIPQGSIIETARLTLRGLTIEDSGLLGLYASDERVARMTTRIPHPYPPGAAEAYIKHAMTSGHEEGVWALDAGGANGLVGMISLRADDAPRAASLGYWVAPAFWGSGLASEAVAGLCDVAGQWGLDLIVAQVFQDNPQSIRVLERNGFTPNGTGEVYSLARSAMVKTYRYTRRVVE